MKFDALVDEESAERIGVAWLRAAVSPVSAYGTRAFGELRPYAPGDERTASERARDIECRARTLSEDSVAFTLTAIAALPDVASILARAAAGEALDDPDFHDVLHFCDGVDRLAGIGNAATGAIAEALSPGRFSATAFYLADTFDDSLGAARDALSDAQAEFEAVRGRERAAAAQALGRDEIAEDEFIVMRTDLRGRIPAEVRILREAATYLSCAIDYGAATLQALERREAAVAAVAEAEMRARRHLSAIVENNAAGLSAAAEALATLDVTLSAVRYAQRYRCTAPNIVEEPLLVFKAGRFPRTEEQLHRVGREFVPIDIALDGPAVVTGPNMGGKTVAMQTCGFVAVAAAFGLPVPAKNARVALFDRIAWLGIGRIEHDDGLLSSFASEIVALKIALAGRTQRLAVFVDEFARTTSPAEGMALTVALLQRLRELRACGLAATHLPGIAEAADVPHFAVRDFHVVQAAGGEPLEGDAIALAHSFGMDDRFVEAARRALEGIAWIR